MLATPLVTISGFNYTTAHIYIDGVVISALASSNTYLVVLIIIIPIILIIVITIIAILIPVLKTCRK